MVVHETLGQNPKRVFLFHILGCSTKPCSSVAQVDNFSYYGKFSTTFVIDIVSIFNGCLAICI